MTARLRMVSYGGGWQTTAALVLAAHGELDFGVFANVGQDSEHPATLAYIRQVAMPYATAHGIELVEVRRTRRDGTPETLYGRLTRPGLRSLPIPVRMPDTDAPGTRSCTADFKIRVIARWQRQRGATPTRPALTALGITLDEVHRARTDSGIAWQVLCYPLLERGLRRADCPGIIRGAGLPVPPKSAFWFCLMGNPAGLVALKDHTRRPPREPSRPHRDRVGLCLLQAGPLKSRELHVSATKVGPLQVGVGKVGSLQIGTGEVGPLQIGTAKERLPQLRTTKVGPLQVGAVEGGSLQMGATKVGGFQAGTAKERFFQVGTAEIGSLQMSAAEVGPLQMGGKEKRLLQVSTIEECLLQVGAAKHGPLQVGTAKMGSLQMGAAEVGPPQVGRSKIHPETLLHGREGGSTRGESVATKHGHDRMDVRGADLQGCRRLLGRLGRHVFAWFAWRPGGVSADIGSEDLTDCGSISRGVPHDALQCIDASQPNVELLVPELVDGTGESFSDLALLSDSELHPSGGKLPIGEVDAGQHSRTAQSLEQRRADLVLGSQALQRGVMHKQGRRHHHHQQDEPNSRGSYADRERHSEFALAGHFISLAVWLSCAVIAGQHSDDHGQQERPANLDYWPQQLPHQASGRAGSVAHPCPTKLLQQREEQRNGKQPPVAPDMHSKVSHRPDIRIRSRREASRIAWWLASARPEPQCATAVRSRPRRPTIPNRPRGVFLSSRVCQVRFQITCPYHLPAKWARMQREEPELFTRACQLEALLLARRRELGRDPVYLTRFGRPLDEVFAHQQGVLFDRHDGPDLDACESGYCMT
jgi:hypothetical protein